MNKTNAESTAQWRQDNPGRARLTEAISNARARARSRLALAHPVEYEALIDDELHRAGLPRRVPAKSLAADGRVGGRARRD